MNYKLIIAYDGGKYQGWQKNKNAKETIQHRIDMHLSKLLGEEIQIQGSGRTDKGVHATGQVANFITKKKLNPGKLLHDLNKALPEDISVKSISQVDDQFHSRFSAIHKTYEYTIWKVFAREKPLFQRKYVYALTEEIVEAIAKKAKPLDVEAMKAACEVFVGTHDFKGFSSDKTKKSTVRTINNIDIMEDDNKIVISINGDGFLYNMVRIMVGTIVEVGLGVRHVQSIEPIFESRDRNQAGYTVPAQGLSLTTVTYETM